MTATIWPLYASIVAILPILEPAAKNSGSPAWNKANIAAADVTFAVVTSLSVGVSQYTAAAARRFDVTTAMWRHKWQGEQEKIYIHRRVSRMLVCRSLASSECGTLASDDKDTVVTSSDQQTTPMRGQLAPLAIDTCWTEEVEPFAPFSTSGSSASLFTLLAATVDSPPDSPTDLAGKDNADLLPLLEGRNLITYGYITILRKHPLR